MSETSEEPVAEFDPNKMRRTKPGIKRLILILSVLFSFFLGLPFLLKSVEIYRAPLPFRDIDSLLNQIESSAVVLPCRFQVVFVGSDGEEFSECHAEKLEILILERMRKLTGSDPVCGGCGNNYTVSVTMESGKDCFRNRKSGNGCLWRCGEMGFSAFDGNLKDDDEAVDELLDSVLRGDMECTDSGGKVYTVVVIMNRDERARVVVGKHRHAWIFGKVEEIEAVWMITDIFVNFFMNGGKKDGSIQPEFMPVGADGRVVLSFSLLNANPHDWIYDWDFQRIDEILLAPVVEALAPIANISVESQVLHHTPKSSFAQWDKKLASYIFTTKDLPFFVNSNEWHLDTSIAAGGRSKVLQFVVSTFIYNHGHALKMLREKCGGDLVRPGITRFATNYIALKSFEAKKPGLRAMFASTEWFAWRGSDTPAGRAARETINSEGFWQDVKKVVTLLEPLVKVLRMVDSERKPTLPHLYAAIDMMKRHVHAVIPRGGKRYLEIIQARWEKMLMHPMHKAAYYLNPKYQYKCKLGLVQGLVDAVQVVVAKLEPNSRMQSKCNQEIKTFRDALGSFGRSATIDGRAGADAGRYIPSAKECPLVLRLPNGEMSVTNGFISPMWGGVIVWNPPSCSRDSGSKLPSMHTLPSQDLHSVFEIFMGQIRQLFGLNSDNVQFADSGISNVLASQKGFTEWELDVLSRHHTCFNLLSCATTLGSLSRLVQSLPRMIIMDEIGKQVKYSLEAASLAQRNSSLGIYDASAVSSRQARALAEDAFFHPSIMSISYYSFEHFFAIYSPFFLPVSLHVLLAAIKEWKRYKQERAKYLEWKAKAGES